MKKYILPVILVTIIMLMSPIAGADELYGGISYNDWNLKGSAYDDTGIGCYGGIKNWVNSETAFGAEIEHLSTQASVLVADDYYVTKIKGRPATIGILGTMTTKISNNVNLFAAAGIYSSSLTINVDGKSETVYGTGLGFKVGFETDYYINDELKFIGRTTYRDSRVVAERGSVIDFSGLELSGAFSMVF